MDFDKKIKDLGLVLPEPAAPVANYVPFVISGNLVFISGQTSVRANGEVIKGRLGQDLSIEQGRLAAQACALNLIAQLKSACDGDLARVKKIVKVGGFVSAMPDASEINIPKIINGCSDLLVEIFGEIGKHARFAVGAPSLPLDCAVEIDLVAEIKV